MKLSRNSLKQLVQEELAGLLETDRPSGLATEVNVAKMAQSNIKAAQKGLDVASGITDKAAAKVKDIEIPEVSDEDAAKYKGPLISTESTMKLSRNDLKALIQEEMGVLLEAPPIDTTAVQQTAKVTQILRLIDGLPEDEISALLTAMKAAGLPIAM